MLNKRTDWRLVSCLLITLLNGCTRGPKQIYHERQEYNEAIQHTLREEMLLNIVRLKYREFPEFFAVGGIVSSYSFAGSVGSDLTVPEGDFDILGFSSGVSRNESPTISYNPKSDPEFLKALLRPTNLTSLHILARTGWNWEHIFRTTIQYMNQIENATVAGGPTPSQKPLFEDFQYLAKLFRELQVQDVIEFAHTEVSEDPEIKKVPLALDKLTNEFLWNALNDGYSIEEEDGGESVMLVKPTSTRELAFVVHPKYKFSREMIEIRRLLDLNPVSAEPLEPEVHKTGWAYEGGWVQRAYPKKDEPKCPICGPVVLGEPVEQHYASEIDEGDHPKRDDIVISTRSFLEILFYLSQGVNVPVEHEMQGLVTLTVDDAGTPFDWNDMLGDMFTVRSCKKRPRNAAVAVPYKGYWFYLDERDLDTLGVFALLQELYSIEVLTGGEESPFTYTLGIGAR